MPEPPAPLPTYEERLRAFDESLESTPVTTEVIEAMASILATIRAREERAHDAPRARSRRAR
jgi:hypothetical protein